MTTTLLKNIHLLATFDDQQKEIKEGAVLIRGNVIEAVGTTNELLKNEASHNVDEVIDLRDHVVLPGLINTHHHMYQSLTRAIPAAQDAELFDWLKTLYPIWAGLTPEMVYTSTQTAMVELLLSGCTTTSDHLYLYPNGCTLDDSIEAAREIGMRFHACRGSMSVGESEGGLPPDSLVEKEDEILKDSQRLIQRYHDPDDQAMIRIALAPCSPFSVSQGLMRDSALMAREYGVGLHTHLAENDKDIAYSLEKFGKTPAQYVEELGWTGEDVWHAHCVQLDHHGIDLFAKTGTGVAHCPCSNMRLASGIAPVRTMIDAGVPVGLGVDGSASNDSGHLLAEARQAMLLQRVGFGPAAMSARQALHLATRGGAKVLNRSDIGYIAPGMSADLVAFNLNTIGFSGGLHDPLASLVFCASAQVALSMVNGRCLVRNGNLLSLNVEHLLAQHNHFSLNLMEKQTHFAQNKQHSPRL